mgnify:CR=1 FL=1
MANRNMLYIIPTRRKMYRSSVFTESWRSCPTAFLLRSGEFIPRHPVHIRRITQQEEGVQEQLLQEKDQYDPLHIIPPDPCEYDSHQHPLRI